MCSSFTALTVSLQMKKKNSSSHSFCDINDKERTGQGTHVLPLQYLWAWGKLNRAYLESDFHIGRNITSQIPWRRQRERGRERKADCLSNNFLLYFATLKEKWDNLPMCWSWLLLPSSVNILHSWSLSSLDRWKTSPRHIWSFSCGRVFPSSHGRRQKRNTVLLVMYSQVQTGHVKLAVVIISM